MSKFPRAFGVYNLTENYLSPIGNSFRGTGDDTSLTNSKVIHIGSAATERMISLTAFIDSYKINLQKQVDETKEEDKNKTFFTDVAGNLSISLSLNIPAHSVNESVNNLAKIEELQRLIIPGNWGNSSDGYTNISLTSKVNRPILIVHFANLITNGRKTNSFKINSFKDLIKKGYPCFVDSISFDPDVEAGFFEFDKNFLYPKNIKLTLELKYESITMFNVNSEFKDKVTIESFTADGQYKTVKKAVLNQSGQPTGDPPVQHRVDDGLFPFHSDGIKSAGGKKQKMSVKTMNDFSISSMGEKIDSFIFIGFSYDNTEKRNGSIKRINEDFLSNKNSARYVMFKPIINNFSRNLNLDNKSNSATNFLPDSSIYSKLDSTSLKTIDYEVDFDVVSTSLKESYQNCAKIQYLMRLFLKKNYPSSTPSTDTPLGISNGIYVYIHSFIESGRGGESIEYNVKEIYNSKAVYLNFVNLSIDVDMESGFYEDGGRLMPKKMKVSCTFKTGNPDYMLGYNYTYRNKNNPQWQLGSSQASGLGGGSAWDYGNEQLFPYNRKTVKL